MEINGKISAEKISLNISISSYTVVASNIISINNHAQYLDILGPLATAGNYTITATFLYNGATAKDTLSYVCTTPNCVTPHTIPSPTLATQDIINTINNMNLPHGPTKSLDSKLVTAISYFNANDIPDAKNTLQSFVNEVNAQAGKKLTTDQANQLVTAAQNVIKSIP